MTTWQSRTRRMIRRSLIGLAAGTATLLAVGATYQGVGNALDRRAVTAPGRFVSVDGHRMHVYCTGEGSPTVVLEAGATGFAQTWGYGSSPSWRRRHASAPTTAREWDGARTGRPATTAPPSPRT